VSLGAGEIAAVVAELGPLLRGAVLQRVRQPAADRLVLELYGAEGACALLLCVARRASRLHLVETAPGSGRAAGPLAMAARRDLEGRRLDALEQLGGDRAVALRFGGAALVAELTGAHANLFLLDAEGRIVAALWADRSRLRDNRPGQPYTPLGAAGVRAGEAPVGRPAFTGVDALPGGAMERWHDARETALAAEARAAGLRRAAAGALERTARTIARVRAEGARADEAPRLQRMAEALVRGAPAAPRGATSLRVTDWTEAGPAELDVPLDPARTVRQNAERLFAQAKRFRAGAARAAARLPELERRAAALEAAAAAVAAGEPDRAAEILRALQVLAEEREAPAGARGAPAAAPPRERRRDPDARAVRTFTASSGLSILVGRDAAGNDRLTFALARGNDLWLHARDHTGSHVVVPLPRGADPDPLTLHEAALLAAYFSGARTEAGADVDYTRRKHVRKSPKSPAGLVYVSAARTVRVRLDDPRLAALLAAKGPRS